MITVTDVVPAGMQFNGASGTDWNCGPASQFPIAAGGTLTCTYIGTGPAAPGASLGTIAITAFTRTNGPWDNCADVAIAAATGVDINLADNKSCIKLTKDGFDTPKDPPPVPKVCAST